MSIDALLSVTGYIPNATESIKRDYWHSLRCTWLVMPKFLLQVVEDVVSLHEVGILRVRNKD